MAKPRKAREGISWIIPDEFARFSEENPIHDVARFVEKPGSKHAAKLLLWGALWNTLTMIDTARAFWSLLRNRWCPPTGSSSVPELRSGENNDEEPVMGAAGDIEGFDFSQEVLERGKEISFCSR